MNEKDFQLFLQNQGVGKNSIKSILTILKDYETYLSKKNLNIDSVNPSELSKYTEYLISEEKDIVLDFLRTILNYANFSKRYELITGAIDIYESYNAMDTLFNRIAEIHGENIRDEIFADLIIPPLGTHPEKKPGFTKIIIKRVEAKLGKQRTIEILSPCLHGRPPDDIEGDKKLLAELGIDRFLLKKHQDVVKRLEYHRDNGTLEFAQKVDDDVINFIKDNQIYGSGVRNGQIIHVSKLPYQTKKFLTTKDKKLKRFYLCYCPWVRGSFKDEKDKDIPEEFCHCSAGWYKLYWDQIFGEFVDVQPIRTALGGDLDCSFAIHIPDKFFSKIT
ncbi:MAG: hypothetical protein ACFFD7_11610 [Candidatus Thorarchaeota archaeon]